MPESDPALKGKSHWESIKIRLGSLGVCVNWKEWVAWLLLDALSGLRVVHEHHSHRRYLIKQFNRVLKSLEKKSNQQILIFQLALVFLSKLKKETNFDSVIDCR
jgi:hypothetical protein